MRPQAHHAEHLIAQRDRLRRAPAHVDHVTRVDEIDLCGKGRFPAKDALHQVHQQRDVGGADGVTPGSKGIQRFAITVKDSHLAISNNHLRADAHVSGTGLRHAAHQIPGAHIGGLNDIQYSRHRSTPLSVVRAQLKMACCRSLKSRCNRSTSSIRALPGS